MSARLGGAGLPGGPGRAVRSAAQGGPGSGDGSRGSGDSSRGSGRKPAFEHKPRSGSGQGSKPGSGLHSEPAAQAAAGTRAADTLHETDTPHAEAKLREGDTPFRRIAIVSRSRFFADAVAAVARPRCAELVLAARGEEVAPLTLAGPDLVIADIAGAGDERALARLMEGGAMRMLAVETRDAAPDPVPAATDAPGLDAAGPDASQAGTPASVGADLLARLNGYVRSDIAPEAIGPVLDTIGAGYRVLDPRLFPARPVPAAAADPDAAARLATLSARETEIHAHLADGLSDKAIARELGISANTVRVHVREVLRKLDVSNRTQAALLHGGARPSMS